MRNRMVFILVIFMITMLVFIVRLLFIQLVTTNHFTKYDVDLIEESIKQRTSTFVLHSGRGFFTDRHGHVLHKDYVPSLILFPFIKELDFPLEQLAQILNIDKNTLVNQIAHIEEPIVLEIEGKRKKLTKEEMEKINQLKIPGVYAQYVQERTENIAPHLIGVTGENAKEAKQRYKTQIENGSLSIHAEIGVSGMERSLDPFLLSQGRSELVYYVDSLKRPLFGYDVKYTVPADPFHPTEVETTIDKDIQIFILKTLKDAGIEKGGLVLLDAKTNDLLSLVSLPTFDIHFPFKEGSKNQMITAHSPGSIFKIVTTAAAIEKDLIHLFDVFDCNKNLYGDKEEPRKLGLLTFEESFAQSCNYTFSQLAKELIKIDKQILNSYATKLGLTTKVGWTGDIYRLEDVTHFPEEEAGVITIDEKDVGDHYALTQTAIGQKNVKLTPLAVANMLATIARGGEKQQIRSATKIKYENGTTVVEFPKQKLGLDEQISVYTAMRLQELLRSVVKLEKGTAYSFLNNSSYPIAGKTGTAEKGENNTEMNHWFAGYFPANNPKYVMVIVDLDHQKGKLKTLEAYKNIVEFLYEKDESSTK